MRLKISHLTEYEYDQPVPYALQQLRMTPKSWAGQSVLTWKTEVEGARLEATYIDQHGNQVDLICYDAECRGVRIACEGEVDTSVANGVTGRHMGFAPLWFFTRTTDLTKAGPKVRRLVAALGADFDSDPEKLHALSTAILETVAYETGKTHIATRAEQALEAGHGVCQDHAHIFISAARLMGYPARYVGGYLLTEGRVEQEAGHAWAEVHVDGLGWVGFDVSNGVSPDERYVPVATGLDYAQAAPASGIIFGDASETLRVSVRVEESA